MSETALENLFPEFGSRLVDFAPTWFSIKAFLNRLNSLLFLLVNGLCMVLKDCLEHDMGRTKSPSWVGLEFFFGDIKETSHIFGFDSFPGMGSCLLPLCCSLRITKEKKET